MVGLRQTEDAVQEIFLELWRCAYRFDPGRASESTFVAMVARRRLIDRRRRLAREAEISFTPIEDLHLTDRAVENDRIGTQDEAARAAAALGTLRPEQQQVLRLSVFQGLSHQHIAESLQIPLGTVKTHIRRGLMRIRELLQTGGVSRSEGVSS